MADPITRYATVADLGRYAIAEAALEGIDADKIDQALEYASRQADDLIGAQYGLPLLAISTSLTRHTAVIAAYEILAVTGYNPDSPRDDIYSRRAAEAREALKAIGRGVGGAGIIGSGVVGSGGQAGGSAPQVTSSSARGFSGRGGPDGSSSGGFVGD